MRASTRLSKRTRDKAVVLGGCGGGCDVYGTMYLYNQVANAGATQVVLANFLFSSDINLGQRGECILQPNMCYRVLPNTQSSGEYFPEATLASHLNQPVYAFCGGEMSIGEIASCHNAIFKDTVQNGRSSTFFLVDGGCDAILKGDEACLGTPEEDMLHLKPTALVLQCQAAYVCVIVANIDEAHGVKTLDLMTRLHDTHRTGTMLFAKLLTLQDQYAPFYCDMVSHCSPINTIVQSLTSAAITF